MLAARIGAARDVYSQTAHLGEAFLVQAVADGVGQTPGLGHGQVAGVGAGAGHNIAQQLRAGLGHADRRQGLEQPGKLVLGQVAEDDVLAVGDPALRAQFPLDVGQRVELVGGDVAQAGPGVGRDGALGRAPHHVGLLPPFVRRPAADGDRHPLTHRCDLDFSVAPSRSVAVDLHQIGDAAGPTGGG